MLLFLRVRFLSHSPRWCFDAILYVFLLVSFVLLVLLLLLLLMW